MNVESFNKIGNYLADTESYSDNSWDLNPESFIDSIYI
jgi:hypothetical protein